MVAPTALLGSAQPFAGLVPARWPKHGGPRPWLRGIILGNGQPHGSAFAERQHRALHPGHGGQQSSTFRGIPASTMFGWS